MKLKFESTQVYYIFIGILLCIHILGLNCDVFNGDSALHISIAKQMAFTNDWISLNSIISDVVIDKPHLSYWIWAIFIKLFGNHSFAVKLPVFLSLIILCIYLYRFCIQFYTKEIALSGVIILLSSMQIIVSTNDVRIDIFLITWLIVSLYYFSQYILNFKFVDIVLGSIFLAIAILTKGIFIIFPIGTAILCHLYFTNQLKRLIHPIWILSLLIVIIGILPELWALKLQFQLLKDSHILGMKASNYLQFFFWDSQFGRFNSNLGQLQASGDKFFFIHTLLWTFAPWSLLLLKNIWIKEFKFKEFYSLTVFLSFFTIHSLSKTQLSHHSVVMIPFLSIFLAQIIHHTQFKSFHLKLEKLHFLLLTIIAFGLLFLMYYWDNKLDYDLIFYLIVLIIVVYKLFRSTFSSSTKLLFITTSFGIFIGLVLNTALYPEILNYQAGTKAAKSIEENKINRTIHEIYTHPSLFNFHTNQVIKRTQDYDLKSLTIKDTTIVYTGKYGYEFIHKNGFKFSIIDSFPEFRTTVLTKAFFDPNTRDQSVDRMYLIALFR